MKAYKLVRIALISAILLVSQIALAALPNCELVSILLIVFTLVYGKDMLLATFVFAMMEAVIYGFGLWVLMYFYVWPLLVLVVLLLRKVVGTNFILWAVVAGTFGMLFGALCSLAYIPVGWSFAISYFVAGLPWDIVHSISNFIVTFVLGEVLYRSIKRVERVSK